MVGVLKRLLGGLNTDEQKEEQVFFAPASPAMDDACRRARYTFRYFWREMAWERRRIVPACEMAGIKAPFSDGARVEHMWVGDVAFDGREVSGVLLNSPEWLESIAEGDPVRLPLARISDWMYVIRGRAYGAFTVNAMRSVMSADERAAHDAAWGFDFGDPSSSQLVPTGDAWNGADAEHPMSVNMAKSLADVLGKNPGFATGVLDSGWTHLHDLSLAGSLATVSLLVEHGAHVNAATPHGMTALMLAESLQWTAVAEYLVARGAVRAV
jgi:uncharacterized protein YegJ (DUF2314 family)